MYKITAIVVVAIFAYVASEGILGVKKLNEPQYEIRDGNCTRASMSDLVHQEHMHKSRIPFTTREGTVEWFGDETIYCVMALSEKEAEKGSTVEITKGGVGHNFVSLHLQSAQGHGFEYNIQIFGRWKRK